MRNTAYFFITAIGVLLALIYGQAMIVQLIIAYLLWFTTIQLKKIANKCKLFSKVIPQKLQSLIILTLLLYIGFIVINTLINNITGLIQSFNNYQGNLNALKLKIEDLFHIDLVSEISKLIRQLDIKSLLSQFTETLSNLLSSSMMVLIYLLFIFLETGNFHLKLNALFPETGKREKFIATFQKIEQSLARYFFVKTLMSILTAFLSFIVFIFIDIDSPLLWSSFIFLLNYIPTIGSLIATVFPALFSLLQFARFTPAIIILIAVGCIQQIVGNFIEPKLMGKTLNISPIVTIISLTIWGKIWGMMGMLLSVPIMVIVIIVLSQFHATQKIAILLSEKGKINQPK